MSVSKTSGKYGQMCGTGVPSRGDFNSFRSQTSKVVQKMSGSRKISVRKEPMKKMGMV